MAGALMCLGDFVFDLAGANYDSVKRQLGWRYPSTSRVGVRPARQFTGVGDETVTLAGCIYPEIAFNGIPALDQLEAMGDMGEPQLLVSGDGSILGSYIIEGLETTSTFFLPDGTPRKIEFSLTLQRVDDDTGTQGRGQ